MSKAPAFRLVSKMTDDEHAALVLASRRNRLREADRVEIDTLRKASRRYDRTAEDVGLLHADIAPEG
jgi:hypothetical protein